MVEFYPGHLLVPSVHISTVDVVLCVLMAMMFRHCAGGVGCGGNFVMKMATRG